MQLTELQPKPQTLNFNGHEFTMILINGEPYFNANEVANTLEFGNPHQAIATHVDKDDIQKMEVIDSLGRKQLANFLNESGLYALTFGSKKESSKKFKKWVTSEVLPSIRKTGSYSLQPQIALPNFTDPAEAAEAWAKEYREKQALAIALEQAQPKINHYDKVVERKNLLNATQVGEKLDGMSAIILNRHLTELGVYNKSVKRGKVFSTWFIQKGYGEMKQSDAGFDQALFTQKGQAWVIEQLTSEGVV